MNIVGFEDAFKLSQPVRLREEPPLDINFASPLGLAIMKLIAWADRNTAGNKDAIDLACAPQLLSRQIIRQSLTLFVMHFLQWDQCNVRPEPQQCLYFFPLPQGQGALRPTFDFSADLLEWGEVRVFPEPSR